MTVSRLLDEMTVDEYTDWQAYDRVEGLSDWRQDVRMAKGFAALMSMHLKKGSRGISPNELMPNLDEKYKQRDDWKSVQAAFIAMTGGING